MVIIWLIHLHGQLCEGVFNRKHKDIYYYHIGGAFETSIIMKKTQDELDVVVGCHQIVNENGIPQYLQVVVKEIFYLHCPTPSLLPHKNMKSCEVWDYYIPTKTCTFVNIWVICRNLVVYENPFAFNLERFVGSEVDLKGKDFQLLPFGYR